MVQRRAVRALVPDTRSTRSRPTRSSCSSTAGRRSAAHSGSTRRESAPTGPISATTSCRSSTVDYPTGPRAGPPGQVLGGYGAIVNALARPDLFGAFAAHAPDALFDVTIAQSFPAAARELRDRFGGSLDAFWAGFDGLQLWRRRTARRSSAQRHSPTGTGRFPSTSRPRSSTPDAWSRWLDHDPVRLVAEQPAARSRPPRGVARCGPQRRVLPRPRRRGASPRAARAREWPRSGCVSSSSQAATGE